MWAKISTTALLVVMMIGLSLETWIAGAFVTQHHRSSTTSQSATTYYCGRCHPPSTRLSEEGIRNNDDSLTCLDESRRQILSRVACVASLVTAAVITGIPFTAMGVETKTLSEEYRQGTAALAEMDDLAPVPREAYKKLPSGVIVADLRRGKDNNNDLVKQGSRVNMQWVLRKSNGYFVDSSEVANEGVPFIFTVGDGTAIAGLDEGIRGMGVGGVRRLLIPPSLAYVQGLEDGKPGPLPKGFGPRQQMRRVQEVRKDVPGEYIFMEVQVTRVR